MTERDSNKPLDTSRRNFLKQSIALAGAVGGIAALGLSAPASLRSAAWAAVDGRSPVAPSLYVFPRPDTLIAGTPCRCTGQR